MENNNSQGGLGSELKYLFGILLIFLVVFVIMYFIEILFNFLFHGYIFNFSAIFFLMFSSIPFFAVGYFLKNNHSVLKGFLNLIGALIISPIILLFSIFFFIYPFTILLIIFTLFIIPYSFLKYYLITTLNLFGVVLSPEFHAYLYLSITPIIIVSLNSQFRFLTTLLFKNKIFTKYFKSFTDLGVKWAALILSEKNLKLGVYVAHFIALVIVNLDDLQGYRIYDDLLLIKTPLLQAFITFIAFDRITVLLRSESFKPSLIYLSIMLYSLNRLKPLVFMIFKKNIYFKKLHAIQDKLKSKVKSL